MTKHKEQQKTRKACVVGLGMTGLSCVRYLRKRGIDCVVADTRKNPPELEALQKQFPDVEVRFGEFDETTFMDVSELVVSPGLSLQQPMIQHAMKRGLPVSGDVELFSQVARAPVIAITGSNGKSTVTSLLALMAEKAGLEVRVGGNIGVPSLELLSDHEPDIYVLELSSFQLEATHSLQAEAAVVLNVSADHLDRYAGLQSYALAKQKIYQGARHKIVNRDDPEVMAMVADDGAALGFSLQAPHEGEFGLLSENGEEFLSYGNERILPVNDLKIAGRHNVSNALAALALGHATGLPLSAMIEALRAFAGLPHRCQWVASIDGVGWINDSKGTNVGATRASVSGMSRPLVLIAGGDGKGADFSPLQTVACQKAKAVVLMGHDADKIDAVLRDCLPVSFAANMQEAVQIANQYAESGDCVLLSPACASFDMYENYQQRGEAFVAAVEALKQDAS